MSPTEERRRARPMSPEERREALVETTLQLLREHGWAVTTRQIAEAAGVAEGTIFRVVESKEELVDAAIQRAFRPGPIGEQILAIDPELPLRERLIELVSLLQERFRATFALMRKVGMVRPPDHVHHSPEHVAWRERMATLLRTVLGSGGDRLRVPAAEFLHTLRLLTFAGSHAEIADGELLTPAQIVDTLLHGLLREPDHAPED